MYRTVLKLINEHSIGWTIFKFQTRQVGLKTSAAFTFQMQTGFLRELRLIQEVIALFQGFQLQFHQGVSNLMCFLLPHKAVVYVQGDYSVLPQRRMQQGSAYC